MTFLDTNNETTPAASVQLRELYELVSSNFRVPAAVRSRRTGSEMETTTAAAERRKPLTNWKREVSVLWSERNPD